MYEGPVRDRSEVAVIACYDCHNPSRLVRFNDIYTGGSGELAVGQLAALPGKHTLTIEYRKKAPLYFGKGEYPTITLDLEVVAGRVYWKEYAELESPVDAGLFTKLDARQFIWFWDSVDEKVVGGYRPQQITQVGNETPCVWGCFDTMKEEYYEDDWERGYVVTRGNEDEPE